MDPDCVDPGTQCADCNCSWFEFVNTGEAGCCMNEIDVKGPDPMDCFAVCCWYKDIPPPKVWLSSPAFPDGCAPTSTASLTRTQLFHPLRNNKNLHVLNRIPTSPAVYRLNSVRQIPEYGHSHSITLMARPAYRLSHCHSALRGALSIAIALIAPGLVSAQIPGHWEQVFRAPSWQEDGMAFSDAEHGVLILDSSWNGLASLATADGGTNWRFTRGLPFMPLSFHTVNMPNSTDVYDLSGTASYVSRDGGNTWTENHLAMLPSSAPASSRFFSNGVGRAIAYGGLSNGLTIWSCSDSAKYFYDVQSYDGLSIDSFADAIFLDTMEFWASYNGGEMLHTTDGGYNWARISVMPSIDTLHTFSWIASTPDRQRFYVSIGIDYKPLYSVHDTLVAIPGVVSDFAETTDDGATWRIDSSIGSCGIYQLSSPAKNKLWAFVGSVPTSYARFHPSYGFADSLFYSPDDGRRWYEDSTTFVGDTLHEMCWPDSMHGYIAASRNDTLLVYRFVPNPADVGPTRPVPQTISITPNPACAMVTIISSERGRVHLLNLLGSDVLDATILPNRTLTLDVSHLPRGMYLAIMEHGATLLPLGKIVLTGE